MTTETTHVTGASDDLIEFDGHIYDEFNYVHGEARLTFDNGVILDIKLTNEGTDGIWRISVVTGHEHVAVTPCPDPTGESVYTDIAVITGATKVTGKYKDDVQTASA